LPFTVLGAVFPVCLKLWTEAIEKLGRRSGALSAVSAIGSLAGAAAAGFLLVPALALETIFGACAAVLIILSGIILFTGRLKAGGTAVILLGCLALFVPARPLETGVICRRSSLFGPVEVIDREGARFLVVSGTIQGAVSKENSGTLFPYVDILDGMIHRSTPAEGRSVLVVGLGAGLLPRRFHPGSCTTVEVDPAIVDIAETHFSFDASKHVVITSDGRVFLNSTQDRYDAIVFDAYGGGNHPYHMLTKECFELAGSRLRPRGLFIVNFLGYVSGPHDKLVRSLEATLRAVFEEVEIFASEEIEGYANVIFAAHGADVHVDDPGVMYTRRQSFIDKRPSLLLTDSCSPVALWSAAVEQRWREESARMLSAGR
jgi:spermidine synthase